MHFSSRLYDHLPTRGSRFGLLLRLSRLGLLRASPRVTVGDLEWVEYDRLGSDRYGGDLPRSDSAYRSPRYCELIVNGSRVVGLS